MSHETNPERYTLLPNTNVLFDNRVRQVFNKLVVYESKLGDVDLFATLSYDSEVGLHVYIDF